MSTSEQQPHVRALELAASAIDVNLGYAETVELEAHLAACPRCRREAATLRADAAAIRTRAQLLPSSRVDEAVLGEIARPGAPRPRLMLLAAAALLLLGMLATVAAGATLLRSRDGLPSTVVPPDPVAAIDPVPAASPSLPSETVVPVFVSSDPPAAYAASPSPAPTPASTPASISATPTTPVATESPYPVLVPSVRLRVVGGPNQAGESITVGNSVDVSLELVTQDLDASRCTLTHRVVPDKPEIKASTVRLSPAPTQTVALIDGEHTFSASCPSTAGVLTARVQKNVWDRQPERCKDFAFQDSPISVSTLAELDTGMIGSWEGCVTTPWLPAYYVSVTFRDNGTYSATSDEVLDGQRMVALYYGSDDESASKVYAVNDLQASLKGVGQIDVYFGANDVVRDELRNVRLMGDKLEFEVFHFTQYGPITFQLTRQPG